MLDELVDLFTEDAVCEFGPAYGGDWIGKEQIRANYATYLQNEGPVHGVMHVTTNPLIRIIDENTAHGRWYLLDLRTTEVVAETRLPRTERDTATAGRRISVNPPRTLPAARVR